MLFTKYSNISIPEIVEEGITRTISKFITRTSTKDIDEAFKKFQYKKEIEIEINQLANKNVKEETFKDPRIDAKKPYSVDFKGYSILPKLNDKGEIEEIIVYSIGRLDDKIKEHKIWDKSRLSKSDTKMKLDPKVVKQLDDIFFGSKYEYPMKVNFQGKKYDLTLVVDDYQHFEIYVHINHLIYDEIEPNIGRKLTEDEWAIIEDQVRSVLYKIAKQSARRVENSKLGKQYKVKYKIDENGDGGVDVESNFK